MILDIGKAFTFLLSIVSLYYVVLSAFLCPEPTGKTGSNLLWRRLEWPRAFVLRADLLFSWRTQTGHEQGDPLMSTLPVRMFFLTLVGVAILFALAWYLDAYYVPQLWRNQP